METNHNGSTIARSFHMFRERYHYDVHLRGWDQYDTPQDAPNYGVWINRQLRQILSFAEGDEVLVTAPTEAVFEAELADLQAFHWPDH